MKHLELRNEMRSVVALAAMAGLAPLQGCVAVGYSSGGGWFVWPGGIGLLLAILLLFFLFRRGR